MTMQKNKSGCKSETNEKDVETGTNDVLVGSPSVESNDFSFFDEQYFEDLLHPEKMKDGHIEHHDCLHSGSEENSQEKKKDHQDILSSTNTKLNQVRANYRDFQPEKKAHSLNPSDDMNEIDSQYFSGEANQSTSRNVAPASSGDKKKELTHNFIKRSSRQTNDLHNENMNDVDAQYFREPSSRGIKPKLQRQFQENRKPSERRIDIPYLDGTEERRDAWYRITSRQKLNPDLNVFQKLMVNLDKEPSYNVIDLIIDSQLYQDENILVINKPYQLVCQGGQGNSHSLVKYLPEITSRLKLSTSLHLCHRLDRDVTGILLLAKGPESLAKVNQMFATGEVQKQYKCLTKGIPAEKSGTIDLPLILNRKVGGKFMTIPVITKPRSKSAQVLPATTHYQVENTDELAKLALLNVHPITGRKHQIRVHLSSALRTPILGDHKYTNPLHNSPQKLSDEILRRFRMKPAQARDLPMFLHSQSITIPSYFGSGSSLNLRASFPLHFVRALKLLKFKK